MSLTQLVSEYGYLAIFIGSLLEGETVLLLSGYFIHSGYLSYILTVMCATFGGILGDQIFFFLGRFYGQRLLCRFPKLTPSLSRVNQLIIKHNTSLIIGIRFMYGLRIVGPIAIGMSQVSAARFIILNSLGALLWANAIVSVGYLFGQTVQWVFDDVQQYEKVALIIAIVGVLAVVIIRHCCKKE